MKPFLTEDDWKYMTSEQATLQREGVGERGLGWGGGRERENSIY